MVNFFTFSFVTGLLTVAAADIIQPASTLSGTIAPMLEPLQSAAGLSFDKLSASPAFDKKGSLDLPTPVLSQTLPDRTRKVPERITQHISRRSLFKQTKVHAYLLEALNAILPHARTIQRLCVHAEEHFDDKLSWELVTELRAILEALNTLLLKVKSCGKAPSPSGIPGAKTPTLYDICQIISKSCARLENVASQLVGCASSTKLYARFAKIRWYKSLAAFRAL
ncbi:hypothetical protein PSTT_10416 [Puccinia striiformis]|uniref:Uncharacterized protein n=1 Tax=Puccinia striiformis TaxID=27350 RepID=A0A2S4V4D3_9BASI|nr:hypothetical protein PSTT_10416 [Puccinia striiformis]